MPHRATNGTTLPPLTAVRSNPTSDMPNRIVNAPAAITKPFLFSDASPNPTQIYIIPKKHIAVPISINKISISLLDEFVSIGKEFRLLLHRHFLAKSDYLGLDLAGRSATYYIIRIIVSDDSVVYARVRVLPADE
ncbi:MAG: hypothetical protein IKB23_03080, partial [Clostridia bacterium]|nr:hypothetical protein [Clostridia bacterium]